MEAIAFVSATRLRAIGNVAAVRGIERSGITSWAAGDLLRRPAGDGDDKYIVVCAGCLNLIDVARERNFLTVRRNGVEILPAKTEGWYIVIAWSDIHRRSAFSGNCKQMATLKARVAGPMAIEKMGKDLCLHLGVGQFFVTSFVASIVFALGIHLRDEQDVLAISGPQPAIGLS